MRKCLLGTPNVTWDETTKEGCDQTADKTADNFLLVKESFLERYLNYKKARYVHYRWLQSPKAIKPPLVSPMSYPHHVKQFAKNIKKLFQTPDNTMMAALGNMCVDSVIDSKQVATSCLGASGGNSHDCIMAWI